MAESSLQTKDGRTNCDKGGCSVSQQCKPVVIDVERVYVGESSLQAVFEPILELSIRDAAKKWLDSANKSEQSIQNS
ncbi:MAG: hypothetical protein IJ049_03575 [Oscillospiraceae bacterium]|nr:hypothetical protein [Oscillospiraceae bacterium]